jgi:hypothetical protein
LRFKGLDLTHCSLEELQKLVVTTTNYMASSNKSKITTNSNKDKTLTDITITTNNNEKEILRTDEPMEDVKIFQKTSSNIQTTSPAKTFTTNLKREILRHDSACCIDDDEPQPLPEKKS